MASNEHRGSVRARTWPLIAAKSVRHRHGSAGGTHGPASSADDPDRAPHRPQDPQDGADDQQDDPKRLEDPDPGEVADGQQDHTENQHAAASSTSHLHPRCAEGPGADRTLIAPTPTCQSTSPVVPPPLSSTPGQPYRPDPAPVGPLIEDAAAVCRSGEYPQTARSVVSRHSSPAVLLVPSRPRCSWSTGVSLGRLGHLSPPVTAGLVAMWSQFRAVVARPGVWRRVASRADSRLSTRFQVCCSAMASGVPGVRTRVGRQAGAPPAWLLLPVHPAHSGLAGEAGRPNSMSHSAATWSRCRSRAVDALSGLTDASSAFGPDSLKREALTPRSSRLKRVCAAKFARPPCRRPGLLG
jgi:hypothetical protein